MKETDANVPLLYLNTASPGSESVVVVSNWYWTPLVAPSAPVVPVAPWFPRIPCKPCTLAPVAPCVAVPVAPCVAVPVAP